MYGSALWGFVTKADPSVATATRSPSAKAVQARRDSDDDDLADDAAMADSLLTQPVAGLAISDPTTEPYAAASLPMPVLLLLLPLLDDEER